MTEMQIARTLVKAGLAAGYSVSVFDGEETTVKRSTDVAAIVAALATTGEDSVSFYTATGERVGSVMLVWGNGEDLISDCTDKQEIVDLCIGANSGHWN